MTALEGTRVELSTKRPTQEWPACLDKAELTDLGWSPQPFNEFIVKIHSRCNLACDYCYVYSMGDSTWENQPGSMTVEVAQQAAARIREHSLAHDIEQVSIILHGGEPLLVRRRRLEMILDSFVDTLSPEISIQFAMQTNGLLLGNDVLQTLSNYDVAIGVSLDGGEDANDRHRRTRGNEGSYRKVVERLRTMLAGEHSHLFAGMLATIDLENDPVEVYNELCSFDPPTIDFLLPHGNWTEKPPALEPEMGSAPYGDWLVRLFDYWFDAEGDQPGIRLFDSIIRLHSGRPSGFEALGIDPIRLAVVETDGSYELLDILKSAYSGAAVTHLNAFDHSLDTLLEHPSVAIRQCGSGELCSTCRSCDFVDICGGGYFPHRYTQGSGFLNPSVFCNDLKRLYVHILRRLG